MDRIPLNDGWLFCGEYPGAGIEPTTTEPVTLPHSVTRLSWRNWDPADWQRVWLYRRQLTGPFPPDARVFLDIDGAMVNATVLCEGHSFAQHRGGYLPWSVELTGSLAAEDSTLEVVLDSRWSPVPPEGASEGAPTIDFLEPGGLYRDMWLRVVPRTFLADVFAKPINVLDPSRRVDILATVDATGADSGQLLVELRDGARVLAQDSVPVRIDRPGRNEMALSLRELGEIALWSPDSPRLYDVVSVLETTAGQHEYHTRIGFRETLFTQDGFFLNRQRYKLFGLNRHQLFPYAGLAMPARTQRRDAEILKQELNCNMVRCSHYPQSPHFLDACDELGLLVWQETPGWQYIGDAAWQDLVVADVREMVLRDRNRPSMLMWGIRVNESANQPDLYARTRRVADEMDGTRPTTGAVYLYSTQDWAADVFGYDDYHVDAVGEATLLPPLPGVPYLVSEAVGALDGPPYFRWIDGQSVLAQQLVMHATVHDLARADPRYAGLLGWAGIDYASLHGNTFESMKWPGVLDTFRIPKPGAAFYQSQVNPALRPVVQPAFFWDFGPHSPNGPGEAAAIGTNCDRLDLFLDGRHVGSALPDRARFRHLRYPPVFANLSGASPGELRIEGYLGDRLVLSRRMSADRTGDRLALTVDDPSIDADGSDATRVVFRAVDTFGNQRPYVTGDVTLSLRGPGVLVGDNPFAFGEFGGVGGVWIRSLPGRVGVIELTASHPSVGSASIVVEAR